MKEIKRVFLCFAAIMCAISFAFSFSGCGADSAPAKPLTREQLFNLTAPKTVLINAAGFAGSGVIVENNGEMVDIATNYHVIEAAYEAGEPVLVRFFDGSEFLNASVMGFVKSVDVALLRVNCATDAKPFELNTEQQVGESVLAVGYNGGQIGAYEGIVSTLAKRIYNKQLNQYMFTTQTTAPFAQGCSGGAIVDSNGNLLGLCSYTLLTNYEGESLHTGLSYALPSSLIFAAYQRIILSQSQPAIPLAGFIVNGDYSVTVSLPDYLFNVSETANGLVASNCKQGNVLQGDKIVKINGIELNAADKMITFLSQILLTYNQTYFTLS